MNRYTNYQRADAVASCTRIDLLLALYDGALERLDRAESAIRAGDVRAAVPLLAKVQLIVSELAAGVRLDVIPDSGANMLRLYEFVASELRKPQVTAIANSRKILQTLREGFEGVRMEAVAMERAGRFHVAERMTMLDVKA